MIFLEYLILHIKCNYNVFHCLGISCFINYLLLKITLYICLDGTVNEPDMSATFCPDHKAPMVLFLDRVYGIKDQSFLLHLLEVGFLPDLRASASLDTVCIYLLSLNAVAGYSGSVSVTNWNFKSKQLYKKRYYMLTIKQNQ